MAIIILGMHRSGTSMTARLLNLAGVAIGAEEKMLPPSRDNTLGYWEHSDFLRINDHVLKSLGGSWSDPPEFPVSALQAPEMPLLLEAGLALVEQFHAQQQGQEWLVKDPRFSLTLPFWQHIFSMANIHLRCVVCLRNPLEVAFSLDRRLIDRVSLDDSFVLYAAYYERIMRFVEGIDFIVTHYDSYFFDPSAELKRLLTFCQIKPEAEQEAQALAFISGEVRHFSLPETIIARTHPQLIEQYSTLCATAGPTYASLASHRQTHPPSTDELLWRFFEQYKTLSELRPNEIDERQAYFTEQLAKNQAHAHAKVKSATFLLIVGLVPIIMIW